MCEKSEDRSMIVQWVGDSNTMMYQCMGRGGREEDRKKEEKGEEDE